MKMISLRSKSLPSIVKITVMDSANIRTVLNLKNARETSQKSFRIAAASTTTAKMMEYRLFLSISQRTALNISDLFINYNT
jgi:hypothetical protein